jgi:hypothetical protein
VERGKSQAGLGNGLLNRQREAEEGEVVGWWIDRDGVWRKEPMRLGNG